MNRRLMRHWGRALLWALAWAGAAQTAQADDDGQRQPRVPMLPAYRQECSACHVAYQPSMLPASSWRRLLSDLPHHFGSDASLDPKTVAQLSGWLAANAASGHRQALAPPDDRITRSAWFLREHDEIPPAVWRRKAIGSASNCMACHTRADQGDFHERDIRIPR